MPELDGRVVLVTGGGRGLGRSHCLELARHGAVVIVNDLNGGDSAAMRGQSPAEEVAAEVRAAGGKATVDDTSVTDFAATSALVAQIVAEHGRLDAVVNNAGILRDRMLTSMEEAEFDSVLQVHLKGTWNLTRHAGAFWRSRSKAGHAGHGRIVNTTSGTGLFGNVGQANYGAAKAAIANLTVVTAMEMQRYGVTANAISPIARTRMTESLPALSPPEVGEWDPYDPANASPLVAWLCSPQSGWLTGQVLRVDGSCIRRVQGWQIDEGVAVHSANGGRVEFDEIEQGLRSGFGIAPAGMPASSVAGSS